MGCQTHPSTRSIGSDGRLLLVVIEAAGGRDVILVKLLARGCRDRDDVPLTPILHIELRTSHLVWRGLDALLTDDLVTVDIEIGVLASTDATLAHLEPLSGNLGSLVIT